MKNTLTLADAMADRLEAVCESVKRWNPEGVTTSLYLIAEGARVALDQYREARAAGDDPLVIHFDRRIVHSMSECQRQCVSRASVAG